MNQELQPLQLMQEYRAAFPLYWRTCGVVGLVILLVSVVIPATYTATTTIMPPEEKEAGGGLSSLLQNAPINVGSLGSSNKQSLVFLEMLQSRTLIEGVVDTLGLEKSVLFLGMDRDEIVEKLADDITVESKRTGSLSVEVPIASGWLPLFTSTDDTAQVTSARVANACRMVLDRLNREKSSAKARGTRMYIERVLEQNRKQIDSLQEVKQDFQRQSKVIALDEQMTALVNHAVTIGTELATAELELALVREDYAPSSPQVELLEKKVAALRQQYERVQKGGLVDSDGFSIPFEQVPQLTRTYTNLLRDLKIKEQINAYLETQRMEQIIQEARDLPTVVVLDPAIVPKTRSSPSRLLALALGMLVVTLVFVVGVPVRSGLLRKPQAP